MGAPEMPPEMPRATPRGYVRGGEDAAAAACLGWLTSQRRGGLTDEQEPTR